jgi:hypothetical protein
LKTSLSAPGNWKTWLSAHAFPAVPIDIPALKAMILHKLLTMRWTEQCKEIPFRIPIAMKAAAQSNIKNAWKRFFIIYFL